MSIRSATLGLWLIAGLAGAADADSRIAARLQGLNGMEIVIEDLLEPASEQCGVTRESVDETVRTALRDSRIGIVKALPHATLYVNVKVLNPGRAQSCIYDANVEVRSPVIILTNSEYVWATVWNRWMIASVTKDNAAKELRGALKNMTSKMVADWNLANPVRPEAEKQSGAR